MSKRTSEGERLARYELALAQADLAIVKAKLERMATDAHRLQLDIEVVLAQPPFAKVAS